MPGPLFGVTINKASKSKTAGALIAVGHGIVEFSLMFLIFFVLNQFQIPSAVQVIVGVVGGFLMVLMGIQAFRNRNRPEEATAPLKRDSVFAGIYTATVNAGFIL
jgi:threonine/homoserine/homoserine lactone efflux protein